MVALHLTDGAFLRSFNWVRWQLGFRCWWTGRDRWDAWLDVHTGKGQVPGISLVGMVHLRAVVSGSGRFLRRARGAWLRQHQSRK